jgi:hypothetical protein
LWLFGVKWEIRDKINKDECLIYFGDNKLEIEFIKNYDPMSKCTINKSSVEKVLDGIGICDNFSGSKKNVMV